MTDLTEQSDPTHSTSAHSTAADAGSTFEAMPAAAATAGQLLRQAREAAGLDADALALILKVPVRRIEVLERDQYDRLPDMVFARAMSASICRTLKIDPQPILDLLPSAKSKLMEEPDRVINEPFRGPTNGKSASLIGQISRNNLLFAVFILLAAIAIAVIPSLKQLAPSKAEQTDPVPQPDSVDAAPLVPSASLPMESVGSSPAVPSGPAVSQPAVLPGQATGHMPLPASTGAGSNRTEQKPSVSANPLVDVVSAFVRPEPVPLVRSEPVIFKALGPAWVEAVDSSGAVLIRRNLSTGESVSVVGASPLSVVVGRVDQTEVWVRGQKYDYSRFNMGNVARFEVK